MQSQHSLFKRARNVKLIGNGAYGSVYKVFCDDEIYARKIINYETDYYQNIFREITFGKLLRDLGVSYILPSIYSYIDINRRECNIFMKRYDMNLLEYLKSRNYSFKSRRLIVYQIATALLEMKKIRYCNFDLKPQNILINKAPFELVICDHGIGNFIGYNQNVVPYHGEMYTYWYRAPELLKKETQIDPFASEIWAFGCILIEVLMNGVPLFDAKQEQLQMHTILKSFNSDKVFIIPAKLREELNKNEILDELQDLCNKIFNFDITARITIEDIIQHKFFNVYKENTECFSDDAYINHAITCELRERNHIKQTSYESIYNELSELFSMNSLFVSAMDFYCAVICSCKLSDTIELLITCAFHVLYTNYISYDDYRIIYRKLHITALKNGFDLVSTHATFLNEFAQLFIPSIFLFRDYENQHARLIPDADIIKLKRNCKTMQYSNSLLAFCLYISRGHTPKFPYVGSEAERNACIELINETFA